MNVETMKMNINMITGQVKTALLQRCSRIKRMSGKLHYLSLICLFISLSAISLVPNPVFAQPFLLTTMLPSAQVNTAYYAELAATGGTPPYTWSIISGTLPPWLNLVPDTGVISGTAATQGTFSFLVRVTDSAATSAQQVFYITVASPPLIFSTTRLPNAEENAAYIATMSVSGGTALYTWSIVDGSLPSGLTIDATTGTISGTPARGTIGTSSFSIRLTDSSATPVSTQRSFTITVEKGSYQSTITIDSGLKAGETLLFINGLQVASLHGGQSIQRSFDLDTSQTISVEPLIQNPAEQGIRYKVENERITVTEYSPYAQFSYYAEYYVEMKSRPSDVGQITGSGWYREGNVLRATAPGTLQFQADPDTQYRFSSWTLPTGEQVAGGNLNQSIDAPGVYTANYDTYYRLTFTSPFGEQRESAWYKSGARAEWALSVVQVPMSGILGFFKGTLNAVNDRGTVVMDKPQNITVIWEPDYTMPLILIPGALLLAIICTYGLYIILRGPVNKPAPVYQTAQTLPSPFQPVSPQYYPAPPPGLFTPPPYYPMTSPIRTFFPPVNNTILPPQSTIVRIAETEKEDVNYTARQQFVEELGKLLDNYAQDIIARRNPVPPKLPKTNEGKRPALADPHKLI
ncbi:MAG: hypothetical protein D4R38_02065 [Dehalococcoidia bacterium]|nr:MAG: hypothetical protein D4R38_02065 [Dehalococcoidia bacterium]